MVGKYKLVKPLQWHTENREGNGPHVLDIVAFRRVINPHALTNRNIINVENTAAVDYRVIYFWRGC